MCVRARVCVRVCVYLCVCMYVCVCVVEGVRIGDLDTFHYSAAHSLTMKCCYFKAQDWEISLVAISFTCKLICLLTVMSLHNL